MRELDQLMVSGEDRGLTLEPPEKGPLLGFLRTAKDWEEVLAIISAVELLGALAVFLILVLWRIFKREWLRSSSSHKGGREIERGDGVDIRRLNELGAGAAEIPIAHVTGEDHDDVRPLRLSEKAGH